MARFVNVAKSIEGLYISASFSKKTKTGYVEKSWEILVPHCELLARIPEPNFLKEATETSIQVRSRDLEESQRVQKQHVDDKGGLERNHKVKKK